MGRHKSHNDDHTVGSDGQFVALESFSGTSNHSTSFDDDESTVQTTDYLPRLKNNVDTNKETVMTSNPVKKTASTDSDTFNEMTCGTCLGQIFRWNPDNVVVKVMSVAKPHDTKDKPGLCEPMPLDGMPHVVIVGQVMTKTPRYCPLNFGDRVLGIFKDEKYYSETYANLPFKGLIKLKKNLEPWQQVSIVLSYIPALQALQTCPFTVEGNRVLLNGGLGPINQALIHLCKVHRAKRIYVPVESQYASLVRELGAKPMGPKHSHWGPTLMSSIDVVVDFIGSNKYVTSKAMLVETGHMIVTGSKDLDSRKGDLFYSVNKAYVDWRLKSSTRTSIFEFMKIYDTDRESFEKDFKYLDKLVYDEVLPIINTCVRPGYLDNGERDTDALDGYSIVEIPEMEGW